jgi:hypothetical protein
MFPWIESFETLPFGIETWNSKYDGRYAPRPATFDLLIRLRNRRPDMRAFYGQDLHWKKQFRGLFTQLNYDLLTLEAVLRGLSAGAYSGLKDGLLLPSSGELSPDLIASFASAHAKSDRIRSVIRTGKKALDNMGLALPASVKAQLRRIF